MKYFKSLHEAKKACLKKLGQWVMIEDNSLDYASLKYDGCGSWALCLGGIDCDGIYGTPSIDWDWSDIVSILADYDEEVQSV